MRLELMKPFLIPTLTLLATATALAEGSAERAPGPTHLAELRSLYLQKDFFTLRERFDAASASTDESAEIGYLRAAELQAFNRPGESNESIDRWLVSAETSSDLVPRLHGLRLTNSLRQHRYGEALASAQAILSHPALDTSSQLAAETRNKLSLLEALADVPPQEIVVEGPSRLALGFDRRVPLTINASKLRFALDTGANFSVIVRSQAEKLGLEIEPINLIIATSTAKQVTGDVAVAESVEIGRTRFRHVVFLVLPDALLTFDGGETLPGLIGFPVVEAMGEIRFRRDNVMEIPLDPPRRSLGNLALDGLDPLTRVRYRKDELLCRLDTGADRTVFYEPFFRRYRERIESMGHAITAQAGGVGGVQEIPAYRLQKVALTIASAGVTLRRVEVYTAPIRAAEENFLYCNVGLDALSRYRAYTINFRDMALIIN